MQLGEWVMYPEKYIPLFDQMSKNFTFSLSILLQYLISRYVVLNQFWFLILIKTLYDLE